MNFNIVGHRVMLFTSLSILSIILFQFAFDNLFNVDADNFLYTELQKSHIDNGKYKREGIVWMERRTSKPLTGLVYDYAGNGKRIEFGMLEKGYQNGIWKFFHENGQPSMENVYENGKFMSTTKRWDSDGNEIDL